MYSATSPTSSKNCTIDGDCTLISDHTDGRARSVRLDQLGVIDDNISIFEGVQEI